jgi:tetratricopeptide (TPR) repeat protein
MRRTLLLAAVLAVTPLAAAQTPAEAYSDAYAAFRAGQLEEAMQRVDALLTAETPAARTLELKGRILHAMGRYEDAEKFYFQALEKDPGLASVHFHLGEAAFRRAAWADALQYYSVHLREQRGSRATALKLVYCYVASGNLTDAAKWMQAFDPADELEPTYYFARAALARALGKPAEADEALRQARTLYGNDVFARYDGDFTFLIRHLTSPPPTPAPGAAR